MIRSRDLDAAGQLRQALIDFDRDVRRLPGLGDCETLTVFVAQLVESRRRIQFVERIREGDISPRRIDPSEDLFDPLRAAILHQRAGNLDEAFWLVFLFVHFGKHRSGKWQYLRDVYGALGAENLWDWASTSANPDGFRVWLAANQARIGRSSGGFGNHRKYQSLDAYSLKGTGSAIATYVDWIVPLGNHVNRVRAALDAADGDPGHAFHVLYQSMDAVASFGRLARFEYLAMIGKLNLAKIAPSSAYLANSTGPLQGARLLFDGSPTAPIPPVSLEAYLDELNRALNVGFQVLEDALCNWNKSPATFKPFRG